MNNNKAQKLLAATLALVLVAGLGTPAFAANGIYEGDISSAAISGSLAPSYTATLQGGGHVAEGVGMAAEADNEADITITLPAGATVEKAFLYWNVMEESITAVTLDASAVIGSSIGSVGFTPCWQDASTNAYRADVTSLVSGSGTYTVGLDAADQNNALGASLVVVYKDNSASFDTLIRIDDGEIVRSFFEPMSHLMTGLTVPDVATGAKTTYLVGDGQLFGPESATFELAIVDANIAPGSDGERWDTKSFDVTTSLPVGDDAAITVDSSSDCLTWIGQIVDINYAHAEVVGGESLSINNTALFISGITSSAIWMIPTLAGIAGAGVYLIRSRTHEEN